ncbi:degenerin-like protein del-10 [Portunus trituberculatus]|uniref:degenerin-like protein del-10 n=1 Tax=Portunus trituberculatus TaxID=210409 RepID=UPI001E1D18AE|nr:degenerin-like protein del-10 [Portunus trituberculatus]
MIEVREPRMGGDGLKPPSPYKMIPTNHTHLGNTFAEISIAGMSRACVSSCPRVQRGVWTLALLTCTALMMAQVWDRVTYYLSTPVTVNVRVTRNQTLRFPIVSFCNKNRFNMTAVRQIQEERASRLGETNASVVSGWDLPHLIDDANMDAMEVWARSSHSLGNMVKEEAHVGGCSSATKRTLEKQPLSGSTPTRVTKITPRVQGLSSTDMD